MNSLLIAALAVLASPTLTMAKTQAAPAAPAAASSAPVADLTAADFPVLTPAQASPDCGALLRSPAVCVTARMDQIAALATAYEEHLTGLGWLAADGDDNRIIFVRRRENGGCDGMQMVAFYDESKPGEATAPGYLGFAAIPGDVCTGQRAAPAP